MSADQNPSQNGPSAKSPGIEAEVRSTLQPERDRNFHLGGRSFYFFDFDDNVAHMTTPLFLFNKSSGAELSVSSAEFARIHSLIGRSGQFQNFEIRFDDELGTFRCFRDHAYGEAERALGRKQMFVEDLHRVLGLAEFNWRGPSWNCFYHATFNQRPISVITARGHHPETIKEGIEVFRTYGYLPSSPNYLSIFPVSHRETRRSLGDAELIKSTATLKQAAIRSSVQKAIEIYGYSPHHRFGMSDDDPTNIQLIVEEMRRLKTDFPEMSFFIIETQKGSYLKREISVNTIDEITKVREQRALFGRG